MQSLIGQLDIVGLAWLLFLCTAISWALTFFSYKNKLHPQQTNFLFFSILFSLLTVSFFIIAYYSYVIFLVPLLFMLVRSDATINKNISLISTEIDIQVAIIKRLADWFEKLSVASLVGCLIGVISSGFSPYAPSSTIHNGLNIAQVMFIIFGVLTFFTTLFVTIRLTIYLAKSNSNKMSPPEK